MRESLRTSALVQHLRDAGQDRLADALAAANDGLREHGDADEERRWRADAAAGRLGRESGRGIRPHPTFVHDKGLRLTGLSQVDYRELTAAELADLCVGACRHLVDSAVADLTRPKAHPS